MVWGPAKADKNRNALSTVRIPHPRPLLRKGRLRLGGGRNVGRKKERPKQSAALGKLLFAMKTFVLGPVRLFRGSRTVRSERPVVADQLRSSRPRFGGGGGFIPGESIGRVGLGRSILRLPCWRLGSCVSNGVLRRQRALRRTGPRPPRDVSGDPVTRGALRTDWAPPVRSGCARFRQRRTSAAAK